MGDMRTAVAVAVCLPGVAQAAEPGVTMTVSGSERCFASNGLPDHETGRFPTRGNPHSIAAQQIDVCVPSEPRQSGRETPVRGVMGIAVNGVLFRPGTAEKWDPASPRGFSRRGDPDWTVDINGAPGRLGLDFNNAHVGHDGFYHYHGIALSLTHTSGSSLVGYAGDGYEIHYLPGVQSGWALKEGMRPSGPGGRYDGTYNEDYVFAGKRGQPDACNGGRSEERRVGKK